MNEVKHITRIIGNENAVEAGLAISGMEADQYISTYISEGWTLQSTHLLRIHDLREWKGNRWWEFWKVPEEVGDFGLGITLLWVLVK